jgi:DNA-binding NarL/FixJ family response regulator
MRNPNYPPSVPFKNKDRASDADDAVTRVVALYESKQRQAVTIDAKLAVAISEALSKGASLREIGGRLGVSPGTVRKMGNVE